MTDPYARQRGGWSSPRRSDDEWGPSTAVYGGTPRSANDRLGRPSADGDPWSGGRSRTTTAPDEGWSKAGPLPRDKQRANTRMERQLREMRAAVRPKERGVSWWLALLVLIVIAVIGGVIDTVGSVSVSGGFNIGIIVASLVAILIVKRSHMFPVVIAPPIVYSVAAVFQLYLRSGGLHDKRVVLDAAANYLVYGFPAIAASTAAVLIVAGIRLITRK